MTTISITHPQLVAALVKPPQAILDTLSIFTVDLWHGATGVAGEAGELLEAILFPPEAGIDRVNLREELGDLYFYIEQIVQRSGIHIAYDAAEQNALIMFQEFRGTRESVYYASCIAVHGSQVLDTVKKAALYNKALDNELLGNQLSALLMCMLALGHMHDLSRQECLNANIVKLSKRYSSLSYSDKQAQDRADKEADGVPARKFFSGEPPALPAETTGISQPHTPRTSDMQDIADAERGA